MPRPISWLRTRSARGRERDRERYEARPPHARRAHGTRRARARSEPPQDRQKLLLRSVDELKALLVYLEAEFDESIDDKEKLVRLVVNQKNAVGMAKRHAKTLLRWRERSRGESAQAGELPAVRESEVMPTIVDEAEPA